jgi:acyl carrier protein
MKKDKFIEHMLNFIEERHGVRPNLDADLYLNSTLDSFGLVEYITEAERVTGNRIPAELLADASIRSLSGLSACLYDILIGV